MYAWWPLRARRAAGFVAAPENLQYNRETPEVTRDYKLLKMKPTNFSNWEITCTNPGKTNSQKMFTRPTESLAGSTGEGLPMCTAGQ